MTSYYPIMLQLQGQPCLIVGGGQIAERKLRGLLDAGADCIKLISPTITNGIQELAQTTCLQLELRQFHAEDISGARLVFAATNNRDVNEAVQIAAKQAGVWVNVADDGETGSFILPSTVRRGELHIAVSTSGASPSLTRLIKQEFEQQFDLSFGERIAALKLLRQLASEEIEDQEIRRMLLSLAASEIRNQKQAEQLDTRHWFNRLLDQIKGGQTNGS